jgi:hypothetical protein
MDEAGVRANVVAFLARRVEEGMEPDDLLCSRNARPEKALVGRAHIWITDLPSLQKWMERRVWKFVLNAKGMRAEVARCPSCSQNAHIQKVLAWDKSASWRARGWAGENVAHSKGLPWPLPKIEV